MRKLFILIMVICLSAALFSCKDSDTNDMTVTYMKGDTTIAVQKVTEEQAATYELLDGTSDLVMQELTAGKEFAGWAGTDGNKITSFKFDPNGITLHLLEKAVLYTVDVQYHAVSDDKTSMTYDVDNGFSSLAYETDNYRKFYTYKGLESNGTLYAKNGTDYISTAGAKLSDKIISGEVTSLVAVWECEYGAFQFKLTTRCVYIAEGDDFEGEWIVFGTHGEETDVPMEHTRVLVDFQDSEEDGNYDINDNIYELFINQYTDLHIEEGNSVEFAKIIKVYDANTKNSYTLEGINPENISFWKVLAFLEGELGSLDSTNKITVTFMFEIVD